VIREPEADSRGSQSSVIEEAAFAGLPPQLKTELEDALIRLDIQKITEIIKVISSRDAALGKALEFYAGRLDYKTILNALQSASKGRL